MDLRKRTNKYKGQGFRTSSTNVGSLRTDEHLKVEEEQAVRAVGVLSYRRGMTKDEFLQVIDKLGLGEALERVKRQSNVLSR